MSHQNAGFFVEASNEDGWEYVDRSLDEFPVKRSWGITHYGGSGDQWRQKGDVVIRDLNDPPVGSLGGNYLECRIEDKPFLSILAREDQWGTWYSLKFDDGGVLRTPDETNSITYGQEWGLASFIKTLGVALTEFAAMNEPTEGKYDGTSVVETTPTPRSEE